MKLVLEGGGTRAAFSAGVIQGLFDAGARPSAVVGSSSGSLNAAFCASEQVELACDLWRDDMPGSRWINWVRQFSPWGKPGLDVDGIIYELLRDRGHLDVERATSGRVHLYLTATDIDAKQVHIARPRKDTLWDWMRASLALPVGYNKLVELEGRRFIDGGIAAPVAFDNPLEQEYPGPTVVILTRRIVAQKPPPVLWERMAVRTIVPAAAREACLTQHHLHNSVMKRLQAAVERGEVVLLEPPEGMPLARLTRDRGRIVEGVAMGVELGRKAGAKLVAQGAAAQSAK